MVSEKEKGLRSSVQPYTLQVSFSKEKNRIPPVVDRGTAVDKFHNGEGACIMLAQAVELISKGMHPFHEHSNVPFTAGCAPAAISWYSKILRPGLTDCGRLGKAAVLKQSGLFSISYLLFVFSKFCLEKQEKVFCSSL